MMNEFNEYVRECFSEAGEIVIKSLADSELQYPYEESKTLRYVFDSFDDKALILELLEGMYTELPEKKPVKAR